MRQVFSEAIAEVMEEDDEVYLLVGDIGFGLFSKVPSDRFINCGICEQSMIGLAAGMALEGLKPWVYTITPFLIERPFEALKLDLDQQKANVKLVGYCDYPGQGPTHAELDAPILMSLLKNTTSLYPHTREGVRAAIDILYSKEGPGFINLKKLKE